ncbi:hypothetical protein [Dactylosporangium sp. CA-233914]|uniref:hypothetical protein n=1 Tax=Dactylosporangium sp. CA-233914 TaxID=3239934 RepID=UPI003D8ED372
MSEGSGRTASGRRLVRRARHRRVSMRWRTSPEPMGLVVALTVLGMLVVSGWYTAAGANAVAQMLAR